MQPKDQIPIDRLPDDRSWAAALAAGDPAALARYERELVPAITSVLRQRRYREDEIAEIQQSLRAELLVGNDGCPAVTSYAGRGTLRSWVLISALHAALKLRRRAAREVPLEETALIALADATVPTDGTPDPVKERYREAFGRAFRVALAALSARERTLLKMTAIDRLTIDQIGALHGVHRATAARWLDDARRSAFDATRRAMMHELGADRFEAESVMRWVQSRLDVSLGGLTRTIEEGS
jgi:RNA polymerase sigma-70 factor, ECF subfamily